MLPVNKLKEQLSQNQLQQLNDLYEHLIELKDHPGILVYKAAKVPGVVFKPLSFIKEFPVLAELVSLWPFVENKASFIITNDEVNHVKAHSDSSHANINTVLRGDNTTATEWYEITEHDSVFDDSHKLYGLRPTTKDTINLKHREVLQQGSSYLFDSHSFHAVENVNRVERLVFAWWLGYIAYHPAYEYYKRLGLLNEQTES